jgi:hypothetical protein
VSIVMFLKISLRSSRRKNRVPPLFPQIRLRSKAGACFLSLREDDLARGEFWPCSWHSPLFGTVGIPNKIMRRRFPAPSNHDGSYVQIEAEGGTYDEARITFTHFWRRAKS